MFQAFEVEINLKIAERWWLSWSTIPEPLRRYQPATTKL